MGQSPGKEKKKDDLQPSGAPAPGAPSGYGSSPLGAPYGAPPPGAPLAGAVAPPSGAPPPYSVGQSQDAPQPWVIIFL